MQYDQPSAVPVPKIAAAGIAGALSVVVVWAAGQFTQVDIPPEVASAMTTIVSFIAGYLTRDKKPPDAIEAIQENAEILRG